MQIKIDLNNKEQAQKDIDKTQIEIDGLMLALNAQSEELVKQKKAIESSTEQIKDLTTSAIGLSDSLKAIQRVLGSKTELIKEDKDLMEILKMLNEFVLSSSAIKLGAMGNGSN